MIRIRTGPRRSNSIVGALVAGVICAALAGVGLSVVLADAPVSGGVPFLPAAVNQAIGRGFVGLGALATAALSAYAFYDAWKLWRAR